MGALDTILAALAGGGSGLMSWQDRQEKLKQQAIENDLKQQTLDQGLLTRQIELANLKSEMDQRNAAAAHATQADREKAYQTFQPSLPGEMGKVAPATPIPTPLAQEFQQHNLSVNEGPDIKEASFIPAPPKPPSVLSPDVAKPVPGMPSSPLTLPSAGLATPTDVHGTFTRPAQPTELRDAILNNQTLSTLQDKAEKQALLPIVAGAIGKAPADRTPEETAAMLKFFNNPSASLLTGPRDTATESRFVVDAPGTPINGKPLEKLSSGAYVLAGSNTPYKGNVKPYVDPMVAAIRGQQLQNKQPTDKFLLKTYMDQVLDDPSTFDRHDAQTREEILGELARNGYELPKLTSANQNRAEVARVVESHIPAIRTEVEALDKAGQLGPIMGRWNEFATTSWTPITGNPDLDRAIAKFKDDAGLIQSASAMAHGGARAAGSIQMMERMSKYLNSKSLDKNALFGQLDALGEWMHGYGKMGQAKKPGEVTTQPPPTVPQEGPPAGGVKYRYDINGNPL